MNTEDLFKYGVTPKEGPYAGMRFKVTEITPTVVKATLLDGDKATDDEFTHGSYDIWREPKTLFEDDSIASTWGNLRKAVEKAGLGDDTFFAVHNFIAGFREAVLRKEKLHDTHGHEKTYIIVE